MWRASGVGDSPAPLRPSPPRPAAQVNPTRSGMFSRALLLLPPPFFILSVHPLLFLRSLRDVRIYLAAIFSYYLV